MRVLLKLVPFALAIAIAMGTAAGGRTAGQVSNEAGHGQPALWLAASALPAEDDSQDNPPKNPPPPKDDAKDQETKPEENGKQEPGQESKDEKPKDDKREQRPQGGEDERAYKQRRTRDDPFLNPPSGLSAPPAQLYNVSEWLNGLLPQDSSQYMVQDTAGKVLGYLTIQVKVISDPVLGDAVLLTQLRDYGMPATLKLSLLAETLQPRHKEFFERPQPGEDGETPSISDTIERVDYLFDRVTVLEQRGGVTVTNQLRQLPQSFDIDELPLIVRVLDFRRTDWPFEAALTDPGKLAKYALSIAQPEYEDLMSAEPEKIGCYKFILRLGEQTFTWWVQRRAPRKLVRFSLGELTYTLSQYSAEQPQD